MKFKIIDIYGNHKLEGFVVLKFHNGPLSGMRQFLTTESSLKMIKNTFCFMLKALFVPEVFALLSYIFGYSKELLYLRWNEHHLSAYFGTLMI